MFMSKPHRRSGFFLSFQYYIVLRSLHTTSAGATLRTGTNVGLPLSGKPRAGIFYSSRAPEAAASDLLHYRTRLFVAQTRHFSVVCSSRPGRAHHGS